MLSIFNSIVFLYCISIGALVLPSIIPKTSGLAILFLTFTIMLNITIKHNSNSNSNSVSQRCVCFISKINYNNIYIPALVLLLLCTWILLRTFHVQSSLSSNLAIILLHSLFLVFIVNTKEYIVKYIRSYIFLVLFMSFFGIISFLIVTFGSYDIVNHYVNLSDLTGGSFTRDAGVTNSYVFPYNFGLVLTGEAQMNFLGLNFYRISGWAHEPTSATLFTVPALLLLLHGKLFSNNLIRITLILIISCFYILCASIGSMLAVIILYTVFIITTLYIKKFPFRLSFFIFFSLITTLFLVVLYIEPILQSSIITSKFDIDAETVRVAVGELTWFLPNPNHEFETFYYYNHLVIWTIISIFAWVVVSGVITSGKMGVFALVLTYIILHTMKGSQESVYTHLYTVFWFYLAYFSMYRSAAAH